MQSVWGLSFKVCRNSFAICILLVLPASVAYSQTPPKGITWKDTIPSARTDAASRHIPIMMFVAEDDAGSQGMSLTLEDPRVTLMLKHFVCIFVSRNYDIHKFWGSFVPWIGPDARAQYHTPLLVFGDEKGRPFQEYRIEGVTPKPEELLKHLEKVLKALAPNEAKTIAAEKFKAMPLHEICKYLSDSVAFLEKNLSSETHTQFVDEARSATEACKSLKDRLVELTDKEKQAQATERLKEIQKNLKELARFTGKEKEKEKFVDCLKKAREAVDALTSLFPPPPIETETLTCKAIPTAQQVSTVYELEYGLKQLKFVTKVSFEKTDEDFKVGNTGFKIAIFTITCDKNKMKKDEIEKVFQEHGYEAKWLTDK